VSARLGTGPVFAFEWLSGSRRWQGYALRSVFVVLLLVGMGVVAYANGFGNIRPSIRGLASTGTKFSYTLVGIQLALVLVAAPAATAGAICLDKSRGTLAHMLMTDLSDAEIVLGKLAARLVSVLGLVGCTAPVLMIATLLGGADPESLVGAFLASIGAAFFGCTMAFALSVWGKKTHEVLLASYLLIGIWLLFEPSWGLARSLNGSGVATPEWLHKLNPILLCYGNALRPGRVRFEDYILFLTLCLVLSIALAALSVWRIRAVAVRQLSGPERRKRRFWNVSLASFERLWRYLPGPPLDGNPVLWREWHRNRPSRWSRLCWLAYIGLSGAFSALILFERLARGRAGNPLAGMAAFTNGFQVAMGLLLLSVSAATALAEERIRGSLDVVLTTPLSTVSILWGKWWGAYRSVPLLCILPCTVLASFSFRRMDFVGPMVLAISILAMGAAITSLGLALGTWVKGLSRTVTISVIVNVMVTVGWLFLVMGLSSGHQQGEMMAMASPFFGPGNLTFHCANDTQHMALGAGVAWSFVFAFSALGFFVLTCVTFNECLGRVSERGRAPRREIKYELDPDFAIE
jgi:ABC-type transport system involved in multi-copper enzyme maturation permease subunit